MEIDGIAVHDGTKGGCHEMTLIRELPVSEITLNNRIAFGIYCALSVYKDDTFEKWAHNWLSGRDRSRTSATAAAARAAAAADAYAAYGENFLLEFAEKAIKIV